MAITVYILRQIETGNSMPISSFFLVLISVGLSAGSQIFLKYGMTSEKVSNALKHPESSPLDIGLAIFLSPMVLLGLFSFGVSAIVWLFVLAKIPLSSAYPFVSLGIIVTVFAGFYLFGESLTPFKVIGTGFIVLGILMVAKSY